MRLREGCLHKVSIDQATTGGLHADGRNAIVTSSDAECRAVRKGQHQAKGVRVDPGLTVQRQRRRRRELRTLTVPGRDWWLSSGEFRKVVEARRVLYLHGST